MASRALMSDVAAVTPYALALREQSGRESFGKYALGDLQIELCAFNGSVWAMVRRPGQGGVALRAVHLEGDFECSKLKARPGEAARLGVTSAQGEYAIALATGGVALDHLRLTVSFTPAVPLMMAYQPRDLYPLDNNDDPLGTHGTIEATQRGLNSGLVYFRHDRPQFGNVLYFQNYTALNDYFRATKTKPKDAVGGEWPELGYLMPTPAPADQEAVLVPGVEVTLSDAILVIRSEAPPQERESARQFLQMLGVVYKMLDLPMWTYRDWGRRAERTLRDLDQAPEATISHYGHRYVHPYTAAAYPDIMVQMSLLASLHAWGKWKGEPVPLEAELKAGLGKFYDPKLKTLRRYLPNVGKDKDKDAVDSWYLYHPLLNLGALALDGDGHARRLFLKSIDYAIRTAHHFKYAWPVQFKIDTYAIITKVAEADGRGQTDVAGIYAWVMLQAFELTKNQRFLNEARASLDSAMGLRFAINYQANLTAWGAAACMRLWRITNEPVYLEQSYVYLGSFFHNCTIWESEIDLAVHYSNFLAVTCLQDAPYMAIYECFDSFAAFEHYLSDSDSGPDLEPAARMLVSEYCKYALERAWYYYPDALPPEAISPKQRETNGHIDRKLSFPLEDLYPDGQLAGQVGQEVYGAGAAFIFASRALHKLPDAPFQLYCDHFLRGMELTGPRTVVLTLDGGETCTAGVSLVRTKRRKMSRATISTIGGDVIRPFAKAADRIDYNIPANGRVVLTWE